MKREPLPWKRAFKDVSWVLVIKLVLIILAGLTIFGAHNRIHVDTAKISEQIFGKES